MLRLVACLSVLAGPALAEGVTGTVYDLAIWDGKLYAGGQFTCAGGQNMAYWQFPLPGSALPFKGRQSTTLPPIIWPVFRRLA